MQSEEAGRRFWSLVSEEASLENTSMLSHDLSLSCSPMFSLMPSYSHTLPRMHALSVCALHDVRVGSACSQLLTLFNDLVLQQHLLGTAGIRIEVPYRDRQ